MGKNEQNPPLAMRACIVLITLLALRFSAIGQLRVAKGNGPPATEGYAGLPPEWYLDTVSGRTYQLVSQEYGHAFWSIPFPLADAVMSINQCGEVILFQCKNYKWGYVNGRHTSRFADYLCGDSMLIYWSHHVFETYVHGRMRRMEYTVERADCWVVQVDLPDTVLGQSALCVARKPLEMQTTLCGTLHSWGMIDRNGNWLIAPQYDRPFRFVNGAALVERYGQKFKIDEKGERVE